MVEAPAGVREGPVPTVATGAADRLAAGAVGAALPNASAVETSVGVAVLGALPEAVCEECWHPPRHSTTTSPTAILPMRPPRRVKS